MDPTMPSYTIDDTMIGQTITTIGHTITSISYTTPPTSWAPAAFDTTVGSSTYGFPTSGYFCLTDLLATGRSRILFNLDVYSNPLPAGWVSNSDHPFGFTTLQLQACPPGAEFTITT
jgi:hypothetical protein